MNLQALERIKDGPAKEAFKVAMVGQGRTYMETLDAWYWFLDGWNAAVRECTIIVRGGG